MFSFPPPGGYSGSGLVYATFYVTHGDPVDSSSLLHSYHTMVQWLEKWSPQRRYLIKRVNKEKASIKKAVAKKIKLMAR